MPDPLPMQPIPGSFNVAIRPPGSKSLTNRALLLASLARGSSYLNRPLMDAEDAQVMVEGLRRMGAEIRLAREDSEGEVIRVEGVGGRPHGAGELNLAGAGTAVRFLSAAAALARGETIIDGSERMRKRPIAGLVAALRAMHVRVDFLGEYGYPPIRIISGDDGGRLAGGSFRLPSQTSSQFISALLMVAPWTREGISVELAEPPVSAPYVRMTMELMRRLGAANVVVSENGCELLVAPGPLQAFDLSIEPDASGASYFWAAGAIVEGSHCRVRGVGSESMQGDAAFPSLLARLGAGVTVTEDESTVSAPVNPLVGVDTDLIDMPDTAMTLAAVACFAEGRTTLRSLGTLPLKECDRLATTLTELKKLGIDVAATADSLTIEPSRTVMESNDPVLFETSDDHRMAMSLALIGLRRKHISIANPACVAKTYPTFWRDLARLYQAAIDANP